MFKILLPDESHASVHDIDLPRLYSKGYRNILIDVDNTITPWNSNEISDEIRGWIKECHTLGFKVCLFSNSNFSRVGILAEALNISAAPKRGKPIPSAFKGALEHMGGRPDDTIMIGDQVFTDVWGGNLIGLYTILVNPISDNEFWGTRLNRFFERLLTNRRY